MLPPAPGSTPLKTCQLSACCLRMGSELLPRASFTFDITSSKSATLSALMTLNIIPASAVKGRVAGTAGWAAAGACVAGGVTGAWNAKGKSILRDGLAADRGQAQLAEARGERCGVTFPHFLDTFGALLFRRHRPEQHVEEFVLGIRDCRLDLDDIQRVGAERLGRLVHLEPGGLLLQGSVLRLRKTGLQLADHFLEVRRLVRLDLHEQNAGGRGEGHLRCRRRGRRRRGLLLLRRRRGARRGRLGECRSRREHHGEGENTGHERTHPNLLLGRRLGNRHFTTSHTKTAMTSFASSMPSRVSHMREPWRTSQPASTNGRNWSPYLSHTSTP